MLPVVVPVGAAATVVVVAAAARLGAAALPLHSALGLIGLLAASIVAEALPVPIEGVDVGSASLATIFLAGTGAIYGWPAAVISAAVTMSLVEGVRRRPAIRTAYNTALYALAAGAAGAVAQAFVAVGGVWMLFLAAAGAAVTFYAVDIVLLAAVVARASRQPFVPLYGRYIRMTALPIAIMTSVTVLLVEVWHVSAPLAGALIGPLVALALYQRSVHHALEAMRLARTDPLTGLPNARAFDEHLQAALRSGTPLAVCLIDVDGFKQINDRYGHAAGDAVLLETAQRLRSNGEAFRLGGDEFALVLPDLGAAGARAAASAVVRRVRERPCGARIEVTVSAGIALYPEHAHDRKELVELADDALYESKRKGKNRVELYGPAIAEQATRRRLAKEPDRAARFDAAASLAHAVDARDTYTGSHSHAVSEIAAAIAIRLGLPHEEVELTRLAGSLHDLGKLAIPEEILRKPAPLDASERLVLERHPEVGFRMLDSLQIDPVATWVRHHHERWDGCGYPGGLAGDSIPLGSRIIFVADAYHAMTSDRTYRAAMSEEEALAELERCAGTQFDPAIVAAFRHALVGA